MPMVKGLDNALGGISDTRTDAGQAEDDKAAGARGGLQAGADSAQEDVAGAGAGIVERPAEDATGDSVTVKLRVIGPSGFGDIRLELPEGYYTDSGERTVYAESEEVIKDGNDGSCD